MLNEDVVHMLHIPGKAIEEVIAKEQQELERREHLYWDGRVPPDVRDYTVILVDDGLATGATIRATIRALHHQQRARIVVAVPPTCEELATQVDEVICVRTPELFYGAGYWYEDFSQTTDKEVHALLAQLEQERPVTAHKQ